VRPDPAPRPLPSPHRARVRRRFLRFQRGLSVVLALAVWAMVNYLSARHPVRFSTRDAFERPLAGKTLRLLGDLADAVQLHILIRPGHEAYDAVRALAARLEVSSAPIRVEWVDPDRDLARAEQLCNRFAWSGGEAIFVETGDRRSAIDAESLVETAAPAGDDGGAAAPVTLFRGETLVAGAIYSLVQPSRPALCFLQGHGERSPDDFDRRAGYSEAAALLRGDNWDVETLHLDETKGVPARCALLVAAGPTRPLTPSERGRIRDYLDRKGRLLLLLDARVESGYEPFLRDWGVLVGDDVVFDEAHSLNGRDLHLGAWADHPVTRSLGGSRAVFYLPRPVRPDPDLTEAADKPRVVPLLLSSPTGRASRRPEAGAHFDPAADIPGPVPVAVAVERGPLPGVHTQIKPARMVVVGDSGFASNGGLHGANASFFLNAVNWLAERPEFIGAAPQPLALPVAIPAGASALRKLFAWLVVVIPLLGLAAGFAPWLRRRCLSP